MVLLRHLLGDVLRRLRQRQGRTLREVSASARVSLGYLSEVERGQKEASSELLAAICTALNTPLSHVLGEVSDSFALAELQNEAELQSEPVLASAGASRSGQSPVGQSPVGQSPVGQSRVGQSAAAQSATSPVGRPPLERAERELLPVARAFSAPERLRVPAGHARGMDSEPVITPVGINEDHPAFDEVTRRVRDLGDMVPV
jgi:transcriptional regulator with XRE-family HTH domain